MRLVGETGVLTSKQYVKKLIMSLTASGTMGIAVDI